MPICSWRQYGIGYVSYHYIHKQYNSAFHIYIIAINSMLASSSTSEFVIEYESKLIKLRKSSRDIKTIQSVQFSQSVMSNSLRPHEPQHARPPCPSPTPGVHPTPCPLSGDAIQPFHPLSSPSSPALNLSQHWGLFK